MLRLSWRAFRARSWLGFERSCSQESNWFKVTSSLQLPLKTHMRMAAEAAEASQTARNQSSNLQGKPEANPTRIHSPPKNRINPTHLNPSRNSSCSGIAKPNTKLKPTQKSATETPNTGTKPTRTSLQESQACATRAANLKHSRSQRLSPPNTRPQPSRNQSSSACFKTAPGGIEPGTLHLSRSRIKFGLLFVGFWCRQQSC